MQQFLKPAAGVAWARVVTAELFEEFFIPVHYAMAAFDPGFRRESLPTLTRCLETRTGRGAWAWFSWHTSSLQMPGNGAADYSEEMSTFARLACQAGYRMGIHSRQCSHIHVGERALQQEEKCTPVSEFRWCFEHVHKVAV